MAKRKTKINFFTIADYIEEEKWFVEEHKKGWKLVKMTPPCFYIFQECNPEEVIYKLDYKNKAVTEDYIQMYKDYGWEYLDSCFGWNYFRKSDICYGDENEKEIFSDKESVLNMINHIFKTRMLPLLVVFCVIIIPNIVRLALSEYSLSNVVLGILYSILLMIYLYIFVHCGFKLARKKKELE